MLSSCRHYYHKPSHKKHDTLPHGHPRLPRSNLLNLPRAPPHRRTLQRHRRSSPCNHTFGKECITRWLRSHLSCPQCRVTVYDPSDEFSQWRIRRTRLRRSLSQIPNTLRVRDSQSTVVSRRGLNLVLNSTSTNELRCVTVAFLTLAIEQILSSLAAGDWHWYITILNRLCYGVGGL